MLASTFGTTLEWYDFSLYGLASALVFGPLFFASSGVGGILASFATFAVGFAARPLGGMLFGNLGDRIGRKRVLIITLLTMGATTTLLGLLPTHAAIGVAAPILLVLLRIVQGVAAGGEFASAVLLTAEGAPDRRRGLFAAIPVIGTSLGLVLASAAFALASLLPDEQFLAWGWRIPFLLSIVLVIVGTIARSRVEETPVFQQMQEEEELASSPLLAVLRRQPRTVLRAVAVIISSFVWGYMVQTFALTHATSDLGVSRPVMLWAIAAASTLSMFTIPLWGWLSDRVGRRPLMIGGSALSAVYVFPFFALLGSGSVWLVILAVVIALAVIRDMLLGPQAAMVAEMFGARVRCSGVSVSREISGAVFGGTVPLVSTALASVAGGTWPVGVYIAIAALVSIVAIWLSPETAFDSGDGFGRPG
ncbi:MHS family MFS transporter [Pseudonocardia kujensis]|uniref:MFS transporter n=1 Tax=Pseudonocardia kujensis TaxID=1128675 RepID=UPI001E500972|nr:MFS transporter [Pseudonocardia kujensis]MCE0764081.1 MHS family MFS transporter [Pseudonocardia kujensis]